jgi:hypothetical protein
MFHKTLRLPLVAGLLAVALALVACGSDAADTNTAEYEVVTPAVLTPGDAIPAPVGDVILTLSGDISVTNSGETLKFDMATIEQLGLVEYTVEDPWAEAQVTYTGVLMSDLKKYAGVSAAATSIQMTALDDFSVDISVADIDRWPIMLATRTNGDYMDIENAGPTRIIFPYHTEAFELEAYNKFWIWNLKSMDVS